MTALATPPMLPPAEHCVQFACWVCGATPVMVITAHTPLPGKRGPSSKWRGLRTLAACAVHLDVTVSTIHSEIEHGHHRVTGHPSVEAMEAGDFGQQVYCDGLERTDLVHVLMPCMSFACGVCICGCRGPKGRGFVMGVGSDDDWAKVTCPACRAIGRDEIQAEQRRQQGNQA